MHQSNWEYFKIKDRLFKLIPQGYGAGVLDHPNKTLNEAGDFIFQIGYNSKYVETPLGKYWVSVLTDNELWLQIVKPMLFQLRTRDSNMQEFKFGKITKEQNMQINMTKKEAVEKVATVYKLPVDRVYFIDALEALGFTFKEEEKKG